MNIVQINAADAGGGAERSVLTLHQGLLAKGHHPTLFVAEKRLDVLGVVKIPYARGIQGFRRLARWLEERTGWMDIYNPSFRNLINLIPADTDVVHFHNLWGSAGYADWSVLPAITRSWPSVLTERQTFSLTGHCAYFHDCMRWQVGCGQCPDLTIPPAIPKDGTRFNWNRKKRIVKRSNLTLVTISDWLKNQAEQSPIWRNKQICRIYNGIDTQVFRPISDEERFAIRKRMRIPVDKIAVLMTGQTLEGFRQGIAMEGFEAINQLSGNKIIPLLVGYSYRDAEKIIKGSSLGIPFQVTPEEMAECYQVADITLATSKVESFGRIAAESQACGTPVVAFDTGGLAEVVRNEVGGLSVPQGDIDGLCQALKLLLDKPELRQRLGKQGREFVEENFEQGLITNKYLELYQQVAIRQ